MSIRSYLKISAVVLSFFVLITCVETKSASKAMEPKDLFEKRCSRCHSIDKTNKTESSEGWKTIVTKMKKKLFSGISDEDAAVITTYLIETKTTPAAGSGQGTNETSQK